MTAAELSTILVSALVGGALTFAGGYAQWRLSLKADHKRLRRDKLEALVGKIHEANRQFDEFLRTGGRYGNHAALESVVNDIYMLVRLYFPEFENLEHRVGRAYVLMLGNSMDTDRTNWDNRVLQLKGELRGFEQDVVNLFQGRIRQEDLSLPELK
jgi:hypothetical protein